MYDKIFWRKEKNIKNNILIHFINAIYNIKCIIYEFELQNFFFLKLNNFWNKKAFWNLNHNRGVSTKFLGDPCNYIVGKTK